MEKSLKTTFENKSEFEIFNSEYKKKYEEFQSYLLELDKIENTFLQIGRDFNYETKNYEIDESKYSKLLKYDIVNNVSCLIKYNKSRYLNYEEDYYEYYYSFIAIPEKFINLYYQTKDFKEYKENKEKLKNIEEEINKIYSICNIDEDGMKNILSSSIFVDLKKKIDTLVSKLRINRKNLTKYVSENKKGIEGAFDRMCATQRECTENSTAINILTLSYNEQKKEAIKNTKEKLLSKYTNKLKISEKECEILKTIHNSFISEYSLEQTKEKK